MLLLVHRVRLDFMASLSIYCIRTGCKLILYACKRGSKGGFKHASRAAGTILHAGIDCML
jgi:hypothetical protein